jgi:hypothetical protein
VTEWDRELTKYRIDRIHYSTFDVRTARNALEKLWGKFNQLIYWSMTTLIQRTMHGRRVFISFFLIRSRRGDIAERPLHPIFLGNLMGMNSLIKGLNNPLI